VKSLPPPGSEVTMRKGRCGQCSAAFVATVVPVMQVSHDSQNIFFMRGFPRREPVLKSSTIADAELAL
jgi:hypothetical protein